METGDIRKGDYFYERYSAWSYYYIVKAGSGKALTFHDNKSIYFDNDRGCNLGNLNSFVRKATKEEKKWLDACIKADELVPMPQLIDNYEMY